MNKNKNKLNRRRYIGNALSNAFFPVLASLGLTLGSTALAITVNTKTSAGESAKSHEIVPVVDPQHPDWTVTPNKTKAKMGDEVTFTASKTSNTQEPDPIGIRLNEDASYKFESGSLSITIKIPFASNMDVSLIFPSDEDVWTVTFHLNDGSETTSQVHVKKDEGTLTEPLPPKRDKHIFQGWYTDAEGGDLFDFSQRIENDIDLYAHWTIDPVEVPYTITLEQPSEHSNWTLKANNETGTLSNVYKGDIVNFTVTTDSEDKSFTPTKIVINNQSFLLDKTSATEYRLSLRIPFEEDMTASVDFTPIEPEECVVTFDTDGGSSVPSEVKHVGDKIDKPQDPSKTGYTFAKWVDLDGNEWNFDTTIEGNVTLKAIWNIEKYTISFESDDGVAYSDLTLTDVPRGTIPYPKSNPTKDATAGLTYTFDHWVDQTPGYESNNLVPATRNTTYTAVFTSTVRQYNVTFDLNGGTGDCPTQKIDYEGKATAPTNPTRDNYTFKYWYTTDETTAFDFDTQITTDVTLHAKWEVSQTYTIKFVNADDAHTQLQSSNFNYNELPTYSGQTPTLDKPGYKTQFIGWKEDGSTEMGIKPVTKATTYIAQYSETLQQQIVTFDVGTHGTVESTPAPQAVYYNEKATLPTVTPVSSDGWTFGGWYTENENYVYEFDFTNTPITSDTTIYAQWLPPVATTSDINVNASGIITGLSTNKPTAFTIPETLGGVTVTSIASGAFNTDDGRKITNIHLPATVTTIGEKAFSSYGSSPTYDPGTKLEYINLENVQTIGNEAFCKCKNLKKICLSQSKLTSVGFAAFRLAKINYVTWADDYTAEPTLTYNSNGYQFADVVVQHMEVSKKVKNLPKYSMVRLSGCTDTIYYNGTQAEWNAISKDGNWQYGSGWKIVCTGEQVK